MATLVHKKPNSLVVCGQRMGETGSEIPLGLKELGKVPSPGRRAQPGPGPSLRLAGPTWALGAATRADDHSAAASPSPESQRLLSSSRPQEGPGTASNEKAVSVLRETVRSFDSAVAGN